MEESGKIFLCAQIHRRRDKTERKAERKNIARYSDDRTLMQSL